MERVRCARPDRGCWWSRRCTIRSSSSSQSGPKSSPPANRSMYGLAAGIWTKDVQKAHRVARAIKAGTVWINTYNFYDPAAPFGGYKFSGFGRDLGREALDNYTELKTVWVGL